MIRTTIPELKTEKKFDGAALTRDLPYILCNQDYSPLGLRKLKFIEQELAYGRTHLTFLLGSAGKGELRGCNNLYYNNLVLFYVIYQ